MKEFEEFKKVILKKYYDLREEEGYYKLSPSDFEFEISEMELRRLEVELINQNLLSISTNKIIYLTQGIPLYNGCSITNLGIYFIENNSN